MLKVTVATWIGNAAAVLSGTWGAVTRRAQQSGFSRTTVYTHAQHVVQAVASEQAGGGCVWPFSRILMVYVWTAARCLAVSRIDTKYQSTSQPCSL